MVATTLALDRTHTKQILLPHRVGSLSLISANSSSAKSSLPGPETAHPYCPFVVSELQ